ncbi:MAG: BMP family ABC transporter substrate-binding protein, partial [Chloroflexi bacterium]
MRKNLWALVSLMLLASMLLAACGGGAEEKAFRVGLVTDVGRINDRSFNQSAWEGVEAAGEALGAEI